MFPLLFSSPILYKTKSRDHSGRSNIYETPKSFFVELEAAGFTRDSLNISLENNTLKISGQIEIELPEGFEQLKSRSFSRTFRFSQNIDEEHICATHSNGLLTVELPKRAARKIELSLS